MFGSLYLLLSGTVIAFLLRLYLKKWYRFWEILKVPHTKPRFPFGELQSNHGWKKNLGVLYDEIYRKFANERFCGIWFFLSPILIVRDPELMKNMMVKDFSHFHDRGIYYNEKDDPLSAHMFAMDGEKWKNIRVKLSPTFTSAKMKMMFPLMVTCAKEMKDYLRGPSERGEVIEIAEIMARFTTDVISLCAFGIKTNSMQNPTAEFRKMGKKTIEPSIRNVVIFLLQTCFPKLLKLLRARVVYKDVADYFLKTLREMMEYREKKNLCGRDFLQLLIDLKNGVPSDYVENSKEVKGRLTFEEAAAEAFVFFLAGSETSSSTLQYVLYELAKNPTLQRYLRGDIVNHWDDFAGVVSYEFVNEIPYLDQIIDETLRKYPIVPTLVRECVKDYKIPDSDVTIPKNTLVHFPIYSLHRDEKYFPEPDKFDPERFSEKEKHNIQPYTYMPFGEGPRNCIGKRFGLMQVKVALIYLLGNYEFELPEEEKEPLTFTSKSFMLVPSKPIKLRIKLLGECLFSK